MRGWVTRRKNETNLRAEVERLHRNEKEAQQHIAAIAALWRIDTEKLERLTAEFKLMLATAPWSDKDGHTECLKIARRALGQKP
jgi:hypothetical protein